MAKRTLGQRILQQSLPPEVRRIRRIRETRQRAEARLQEQRTKPRITIHELNKSGVQALQKAGITPQQLRDPDSRSGFIKTLDWLDLSRNTVAQGIASLTGFDKSKIKDRATFGQKRIFMSDILGHLGVKNKIVRAVGGFLGDVAIDPLTYLTKGAMTGLKISRFLPKAKPAFVKTIRNIAKGTAAISKLDPNLVKAFGGASRLAKTMRLAQLGGRAGRTATTPAAKAAAVKAFQKKLMGKFGGRLTKTLQRKALTGDKATREALKKGLFKGHQLLGVPFTGISGPTLKFGKQARLYKALASTKGFKYQAGIKKLIGNIQKLNTLTSSVEKFALTKRLDKAKAAASQAKVLKGQIVAQANRYELGGVAGERQMSNLMAQAQNLLAKSRETTLAPAIQQAERAAYYGKAAKTRLGRGVQEVVGSGKSPFRSRELGALDRMTFGGSAAEQQVLKNITPMSDELANGLVRDGLAGSVDEAYDLINAAIEVGEIGRVKLLHASSPLHGKADVLAQIFARPDFQKYAPVIKQMNEKLIKLEKASGIKTAPFENYMPHVLSQEARPFISKQLGSGPGQHGVGQLLHAQTAGGSGSMYTAPFVLKRNRLIEVIGNDGIPKEFVTSSVDDIARFRKANPGWTQAFQVTDVKGTVLEGSDQIHNAKSLVVAQQALASRKLNLVPKQWNPTMEWYNEHLRQGKFGKTILGDEGVNAKLPRLFENDPAKIMGKRVAQHERAMGMADFNRLVRPTAVKMDIRDAAHVESLGLRFPKELPDNHPILEWTKDSIYTTKGGGSVIREAFPIPVANSIDRMAKLFEGGKETNALLKFFDMTLAWFKRWALYHPAYPGRNVFDNGVGIFTAGGNLGKTFKLAFADRNFSRVAKAIDTGNLDELGNAFAIIAGKKVPLRYMADHAIMEGYRGAGRTAAQIAPAYLQGTGIGPVVGRRVNAGVKYGMDWIRNLNNIIESRMRLATWWSFLDDGMNPRMASMQTILAMPDLADITRFEKQFMTRIFPWYRWAKNNGARQLFHHLPQNPAFIASIGKFQHLIEAFDERVPNNLRPQWMKESQAAQFLGDDKEGSAWLMRNWFPFEEVQSLAAGLSEPAAATRFIGGHARPGLKFIAETATGSDIFRQRRMEPFTLSEAVGLAPKAFLGASGTPLDNLLAIRPLREYGRRVGEQPGVGGKIARGFLGGAVQPLSAERGLQEIDIGTAGDIAKLRRKIIRAKENNDTVELQNLLVQLMRLQVQRQRQGLTIPKDTQRVLAEAGMGVAP